MAEAIKRAIEPVGCVALVMALALFPVAAHIAQAPPVPKSPFFMVLLLGLPAGALALAVISLMRRSRNPRFRYLQVIPVLAIFLATLPALMAIRVAGEMPLSRAVANQAWWRACMQEIINNGCLSYAANHAGSFPADLSGFVPAISVYRDHFAALDGKTIYLGKGLRDDVESANVIVVLYSTGALPVYIFDEADVFKGMGRVVGFADGHTETVPESQLSKVFAVSNAARMKVGLAVIAPDIVPVVSPATGPVRE